MTNDNSRRLTTQLSKMLPRAKHEYLLPEHSDTIYAVHSMQHNLCKKEEKALKHFFPIIYDVNVVKLQKNNPYRYNHVFCLITNVSFTCKVPVTEQFYFAKA